VPWSHKYSSLHCPLLFEQLWEHSGHSVMEHSGHSVTEHSGHSVMEHSGHSVTCSRLRLTEKLCFLRNIKAFTDGTHKSVNDDKSFITSLLCLDLLNFH
jgi:hypothetical protein